MKKDLVSIIVPVYNVEKYVERCLRSLVRQTYPDIEILLISDGSMDGSDGICQRFAGIYDQIRYFRKENEGLSATRNFGMRHARGEYYMFVDSDDFIETDMIARMMDVMHKEKAQLVIGSYQMDYRFGSLCRKAPPYRVWEQNEVLRELLKNKAISNFAWGKLYHAALFEGVEYPKCRFEDIYTTYRTFLKAERIVSMPDRFYHYVQRKGSIMNKNGLLALDMDIVLEMRSAFEYQEQMLNAALPQGHFSNQRNYFNTDMLIIYTMLVFVKRRDAYRYPLPRLQLAGLPLILRIAYRAWLGCAKLKFGRHLQMCPNES